MLKKILTKRYKDLGRCMHERNLEKILSFRTMEFHAIGPGGRVFDNISMKEYSRLFITNNIPPYNAKITGKKLNPVLCYRKPTTDAMILLSSCISVQLTTLGPIVQTVGVLLTALPIVTPGLYSSNKLHG